MQEIQQLISLSSWLARVISMQKIQQVISLFSWFIAHPLFTLALGLVLWLLLGGLFGALARLTEQFWLNLFQFPLKLGGWLVQKISFPFSGSAKEKRLSEILTRLEGLKQEGDPLVRFQGSPLERG